MITPQPRVPAPPVPALQRLLPKTAEPQTKLLLVDFRSGEAVHEHPDVLPYLRDGWLIRSAVPRIVEAQGTRLFVVLIKDGHGSPLTRVK